MPDIKIYQRAEAEKYLKKALGNDFTRTDFFQSLAGLTSLDGNQPSVDLLVTEKENEIGLAGFLHDLVVNVRTDMFTIIPIGYAPVQIHARDKPLRRYALGAAYAAHTALAYIGKKALPLTIIYQPADIYQAHVTVQELEAEFRNRPEMFCGPRILRDIRAENASGLAVLCQAINSAMQRDAN